MKKGARAEGKWLDADSGAGYTTPPPALMMGLKGFAT
jgi:hypothetical protein